MIENALQPAVTWDARRAAHLARRAGFGASPDELRELVEMGPEAAVRRFVDLPEVDEALEDRISRTGGELLDIQGREGDGPYAVTDRIRRWWLFRMAYAEYPLREKLTLFWHDHFACQESKVLRDHLLLAQNQLFRRLGAGSFRELLREVARDPAMLVYLDNRINVRQNPNENWARELLELFTVGVDRYEQRDIVELARVFTGWSTESRNSDEFVFDADRHDGGDKRLFGEVLRGRSGQAGLREGFEAIDRILVRPDCAPFLARRLLVWFAHPEPPEEVVEELAKVLRYSGFSIQECLTVLFSSEWFYADENQFALYKNPVELLVSAARLLGIQNLHQARVDGRLAALGMLLFEPPSVAGWSHGEAWIHSGSIVHRFNLALDLSMLPHTTRRVTGRAAFDVEGLGGTAEDDEALVAELERRILQRRLPPERRAALFDYLSQSEPVFEERGSRAPEGLRRRKVRALVHLLLTTSEFARA